MVVNTLTNRLVESHFNKKGAECGARVLNNHYTRIHKGIRPYKVEKYDDN